MRTTRELSQEPSSISSRPSTVPTILSRHPWRPVFGEGLHARAVQLRNHRPVFEVGQQAANSRGQGQRNLREGPQRRDGEDSRRYEQAAPYRQQKQARRLHRHEQRLLAFALHLHD